MKFHKCIICQKEFKDSGNFVCCPGCGSIGTTISSEEKEIVKEVNEKIYRR